MGSNLIILHWHGDRAGTRLENYFFQWRTKRMIIIPLFSIEPWILAAVTGHTITGHDCSVPSECDQVDATGSMERNNSFTWQALN